MKRGHGVLRSLALAGLGGIGVAFWLEEGLAERARRYDTEVRAKWGSVPGDEPSRVPAKPLP